MLCFNFYIDKNEISAVNNIQEDIYGYADVSKLQFVINNLISNAVSYIGGDEKRIEFSVEDVGMSYRVVVFNDS